MPAIPTAPRFSFCSSLALVACVAGCGLLQDDPPEAIDAGEDGRCAPSDAPRDFGEPQFFAAEQRLAEVGTTLIAVAIDDELEPVQDGGLRFEFDVAEGTESVTVQFEGEAGSTFWICNWNVDGAAVDGWFAQGAGPGASEGQIVGRTPYAPPMIVVPGRHQVEICTFDGPVPSARKAWAFAKTRAVTAGTIDLEFFVAPSVVGSSRPEIIAIEMAEDIGSYLDAAGIEVGAVRAHALPEGCGLIDDSDYESLRTHASVADALSLPVFVVEGIEGAAGFADGIPGPVVRSAFGAGVIVQHDSGYADGQAAAIVIAKYLGLFATVGIADPLVLFPDPLPDTDEGRGVNLMHPSEPGDELTPQQGAVLRSSPLVQPRE